VNPQLVTVVGQPTIISDLDGLIDTEPINVEGLSEGELIREAQLRLPEGVSPLNNNFVEVSIKIEPQTSSKRVNVKAVITGLQPSLIVPEGAIVPPTVNILLKGSIAELEALQIDQIAVTLDVTEFGPGGHLIEPTIKPPGSLNTESVNPELVEVTIAQQQATREFEVPIRLIDLPPNTVAAITPTETIVGLQGAVSVIEKLKAADVQPLINLAGLKQGTYEITPTLSLSNSITLVSFFPKVALTLYDEEKLIAVSDLVTVTNLAEGLRATLNDPVIRIRVAGTGDAQTLRASEEFAIEVNVDTLDIGTHPIPPTIRLPDNYTLVDVTPQEVEITLQAE
jgi:YbbR domain-containing protein